MFLQSRISTIIVPTSTTRTFEVWGKSFFKITNVYLSGAPYPQSTFFNPFSGVPRLSAMYPGFNAVKLLSSDYSYVYDSNYLTFTMPSASQTGYVDVIVENQAGYGALTKYVIKELYNTQQTVQAIRPWAPGVKVIRTN